MEEPVESVVNIGELSTFLMCLEVPGPVVSGTVAPVVIRVEELSLTLTNCNTQESWP